MVQMHMMALMTSPTQIAPTMTDKTNPTQAEKNFSFSLFKAVERDFEKAIENGCYQKKALLTKLLEIEIERLDEAIDLPVPKKVSQFIRNIQNDGTLKKLWVTQQVLLPAPLVDRIQEVCKTKGVVRDAWVNRVLFLATGTSLFDALMPLDELKHFDCFKDAQNNRDDAVELVTQRLTASINPLFRLHDVFREIDEFGKENVGSLYRFKIFEYRLRPKVPMPILQMAEQSDEARILRTNWMMHKFSWCITCWAEIADLDQLEEPDWLDIL